MTFLILFRQLIDNSRTKQSQPLMSFRRQYGISGAFAFEKPTLWCNHAKKSGI